MEKKVRIKQVRSRIGHPKDQKATLDALGLKKINQVKELSLNPQLEGMINKVKHLLQIEEI
ncbi:MAG: 50S ribosomal protein L30 [Bacteroidetes bacterium 4572_77]|nr:MAG: 50S ribosomal protein L30 [Bacteroidetes bacterium 4572_77]